MSDMPQVLREAAEMLEGFETTPYGPAYTQEDAKDAAAACIQLCGGDPDKARTLWKLIQADLSGYMPKAATVALVRAAATSNLVPDCEAPEL